MRKLLIIAVFLCAGECCFARIPVRPLEVNDVFPRFTAADIYGKQVDMEKLKDKVVIVSVSYFDQSRKQSDRDSSEAKRRSGFYDVNRDKGLEVIRISSKRAVPFFVTKPFVENRARKACEKDNDRWTVIIDWDGSLKELLTMIDAPLTFIVDKSGIIRYKKDGFLKIDNEVKQLVERLI